MPDIRNAAILLMSLPEDDASEILGRLSKGVVEQVSIEIARIKAFTGEEQEQAIRMFAECNPAGIGGEGGGLKLAEQLVQKALGKDAAGTLNNLRQSIASMPFGFLQNVDSQNIITYIIDEHPQTIALILSHLPASFGAEIVAGLPTDRQTQVIRRIANMGQTNPDIIKEVEMGLEGRMSNVMKQDFQNAGGVDAVAEVLNVSERSIERAILEELTEEDPELVEEIRRRMFVFEDIAKFSGTDIQAVLKNVESNQWALALKGASAELKEKVLSNMSKRAAEMLTEEMEFLGAVKLSNVERMQQQIVDVVRGLENSGEIEINAGEEQEELVQ